MKVSELIGQYQKQKPRLRDYGEDRQSLEAFIYDAIAWAFKRQALIEQLINALTSRPKKEKEGAPQNKLVP